MQHLIRPFFCLAVASLSALAACGSDDTAEPDTLAPTISLSAAVGADAVVLAAEVSDDVATVQVDFVVDGGLIEATQSDSQGRSQFSVDLPVDQLGAGRHTAAARARDAAGNTTEAVAISFDVAPDVIVDPEEDGISPIEVVVTASVDGASVTFTIDIRSEEPIRLTNFFLDGEFLGGRGDPQQQFTLTRELPAGTHRLLVDVTDVEGNSAQGEVIVEV